MAGLNELPKSDSTVAAHRERSLLRVLALAMSFGICGFFLPYVVFGMERVLRSLYLDEPQFDRGLAADGAASAIVCSFIFVSSAVAHFSTRRGVGFVRSLIVMTAYAFIALIAAVVVWVFLPFDLGNPKQSQDLFLWFFLEYQYLLIFPVTFLPGAIAFMYWQISTAGKSSKSTVSTERSTGAQQSGCNCTIVELLTCVTLILVLMAFLRPVFSQARAQPLAEGVLLWHDQPVAGATVEFYPVMAGQLGDRVCQATQPHTGPEGQFVVHTFPEWRKRNPTVGEFAVAVSLSGDAARHHISAVEMDALRKIESPQSTPIRVKLAARRRSGIRIELSEWCPQVGRQ